MKGNLWIVQKYFKGEFPGYWEEMYLYMCIVFKSPQIPQNGQKNQIAKLKTQEQYLP